MALFEFIAQVFINFFGITQPDKTSRQRATIYICGLLSLIVLVFALFFVVTRYRAH